MAERLNVERVVESGGQIVTVLKFTNLVVGGTVSAAAIATPTELPYAQYVSVVNDVNDSFQKLVRHHNPDLIDGPIIEPLQARQRIELDGRWHLEVAFGAGPSTLAYDVWWDPTTDQIRQERPTAFSVQWETYLFSIDTLRVFLAAVLRIKGSAA